MLTISAPIFDINGIEIVESPELSGLFDIDRRVTRTPTLDGTAAITDFGYSDADRTLQIDWVPTRRAQMENVARMVRTYSRLIVTFRDGCYFGAPESFHPVDETVRLTILVERRLDQ